jgi:L-ornithine Nalpha-acyltransferase
MNVTLRRGRYVARLADGARDIAAAQRLRHLCFIEKAGLPTRRDGRDHDDHDAACRHVLVEDALTGQLLGCFRLRSFASGAGVSSSYAAQFYDLTGLLRYVGPLAEMGRFCIRPGPCDADVLRVAWGALAQIVDEEGVGMLFGCCSFAGTDPAPYHPAFAALGQGHLAADDWRPGPRAPETVAFTHAAAGPRAVADRAAVLRAMPPLLRSYLGLGGRVSDHAVVDRTMNTLHVFTGVEIAAIPPARARALRQVAGTAGI